MRVLGQGERTLMFAHGYGCDQNMWRAVTPAFLDGYRVILFDNAGAGSADPGTFDKVRHSSLHGYAQDVLDIIDELDLKQVNFVGHSVSAMIGALASIQRPNVFESLVMIGPSPYYIPTARVSRRNWKRASAAPIPRSRVTSHESSSSPTTAPICPR